MTFTNILWLLVWSGMYTDPADVRFLNFLSNPISFIMELRPLFPIIAVYICLIWIFFTKSKLIPPSKTPLRYFFFYCLIGIVSSLFLSPQKITALSWAFNFFSPLIVIWIILGKDNSRQNLQKLIYLNYITISIILVSLLPESFSLGIASRPPGAVYQLPFNIGGILVNGAGRFALVVIIVSFVRLITSSKQWRYLWLLLLIPSLFLIMQTQSRTALLGFAVVSLLFIFLKNLNFRFIFFVGPISAYIIWTSGFKWRAQESFENLINLTGREITWQKGLELFKHSPVFGSGFHADRIMLNFQHMHNSFFHTLVQSGALGTIFFITAITSVWLLIFRHNLLKRVRDITGSDQAILMESILLFAFLTVRGFFESTASFFGVDLFLIVPAMVYIYLWTQNNPLDESQE